MIGMLVAFRTYMTLFPLDAPFDSSIKDNKERLMNGVSNGLLRFPRE
jgi:hypothetical protein